MLMSFSCVLTTPDFAAPCHLAEVYVKEIPEEERTAQGRSGESAGAGKIQRRSRNKIGLGGCLSAAQARKLTNA
jgi:hypothetical protein